jgi:hypothetical protein
MVTTYQGDTQEINFTLKDALGAAYDLTGKVLQFRLATASAVFVVKRSDTGGSGLTIVSAPAGTANLKLTPAETAAFPLGVLPWELELLLGSDKYTVSTGRIEIIKGLTGA